MSALEAIKDNDHFKQAVLKSDLPVLVDFWADWCQPCKIILPYVEEIAQHYSNQLKVVKVDIDENSHIASEYNVRGIPTLILFQNGHELERTIGAKAKTELVEFIKSHLSQLEG
jgi:thioredoxin 1